MKTRLDFVRGAVDTLFAVAGAAWWRRHLCEKRAFGASLFWRSTFHWNDHL